MSIEFTKHEVIKYINELSASTPTPTNPDHNADWWNEPFGILIKNAWREALGELGNRVDLLKEL